MQSKFRKMLNRKINLDYKISKTFSRGLPIATPLSVRTIGRSIKIGKSIIVQSPMGGNGQKPYFEHWETLETQELWKPNIAQSPLGGN